MRNVHVIGCGALGAHVAIELAKRAGALNFAGNIYLYDFDEVEERNLYSQVFSPKDLGRLKVEATADHLENLSPDINIISRPWKVDVSNVNQIELENAIIVDCVDNIPTRHLCWNIGMATNTPVIHAGLAVGYTGSVSWNTKDFDNFPLSPQRMTGGQILELFNDESVEVKFPPCQLNAFRSVTFNTAMSVVDSILIFWGKDEIDILPSELSEYGRNPGLMISWNVDRFGRSMLLNSDREVGVYSV